MPPSVSGPYWGRSAPLEVIEIELRGVGEEILVACGIDDEFRHHQTIAIRIGIFDTEQRLELRSAGPSHNAGPLEFGNCRSPETVGAVVVLERGFEVQQVDDGGKDRSDSVVEGGYSPCRPV